MTTTPKDKERRDIKDEKNMSILAKTAYCTLQYTLLPFFFSNEPENRIPEGFHSIDEAQQSIH